MSKLLSSISTAQALILGLGILACATAGLVTGHLSSAEWTATVGVVTGGGLGVTASHVGATTATNAVTAALNQSAPAPVAAVRAVPAPAPANVAPPAG